MLKIAYLQYLGSFLSDVDDILVFDGHLILCSHSKLQPPKIKLQITARKCKNHATFQSIDASASQLAINLKSNMKRRHFFTLLIILLIEIQCYSQNLNGLRTYYGVIDSELLRNENLDGGANYDNENSYEFGLKYLRKISKKFSIETGINYMNCKVKITPAPTGMPVNSRYENLKIISVPIFANYSLGKYFFANGGPIVDFQNSEESFDSQSGIGYGIGIGGKYKFDGFLIYINPNFKRHAFIPFDKEKYHQKLTEFGMQFGIGYDF